MLEILKVVRWRVVREKRLEIEGIGMGWGWSRSKVCKLGKGEDWMRGFCVALMSLKVLS